MDRIQMPPPSTTGLNLNLFPLKQTSIEFVTSILGVPRSNLRGNAIFVHNGYIYDFRYATDDKNPSIPRNIIKGLQVSVDEKFVGEREHLAFDGEWNRLTGPGITLIKKDAKLGETKLSDFVHAGCMYDKVSDTDDKVTLDNFEDYYDETGHRIDLTVTCTVPSNGLGESSMTIRVYFKGSADIEDYLEIIDLNKQLGSKKIPPRERINLEIRLQELLKEQNIANDGNKSFFASNLLARACSSVIVTSFEVFSEEKA